MPTAKKLPSGSWRVQVYSHTEIRNGKPHRVYESFTSRDKSSRGKREAERMAAEWTLEREQRAADLSLYNAVKCYIDAKSSVLSPNSIRGYNSYLKNWICQIGDMSIRSIDQIRLQAWINRMASKCTPKTVRNVVMFVNSAFHFATGRRLKYTIPASRRPDLHTPTDEELQRLLNHVRGKDLEIAILLSAFCSLRRGEICALTADDFKDGFVHVSKGMVRTESGGWIIKTPKTPESDRYVPVPDMILDLIKKKSGRIVDCHPDALTNRFQRAIRFAHIEHPFRFHDLRHYYASTAHYLGVPDAYIMANGGWSSDNVMKRVYREALADKRKEENKKIEAYATQFITRTFAGA